MNTLEYLRRLKAVVLAAAVILTVLFRVIRIKIPSFFPWFSDLLVNVTFIGITIALVFIAFRLIESKVAEIERNAVDSQEEQKALKRAKIELEQKLALLKIKIDELSTLHGIIRAMNQTMELEKILSIILESICKYHNYDRAILCLIDDDKGIVEAKHAIGAGAKALSGIKIPLTDTGNIIVRQIIEKLPAIIEKVPKEMSIFAENPGAENNLAVVPLEAKDKVIGALLVDNVKRSRRLEEKDLRALQTFASQAAAAIENARLYQTEKNFKEELQRQVDNAVEKLKQAQDQLIQSEKLAALGQMAAVVTHEVRNPLSTIRGSAEIISRKAGADSPLKKFTEYIIQEVERLDLVVTEILTFSRKPQLALSKENINKLIEQTLDFLEASDFIKYRIHCVKELSQEIPNTYLDRDQIKQVLLNIVQNACHFMEKRPVRQLTVKTKLLGSQILIEVADTGPGISSWNIERIFEPFFTTKVRGTGLGLSISKNIVESHMGSIYVKSQPEIGTTFSVTLPVLKKEGRKWDKT